MVLDADYGEIIHVEPIAESEYIDDLIDETIHQMHEHLHDYTEKGKILPYTPFGDVRSCNSTEDFYKDI